MNIEVLDCRGMACPHPVVEMKKKLDDMPSGKLTILVDNEAAKKNVIKFAANLGLETDVCNQDDIFSVTVRKEEMEILTKSMPGSEVLLLTGETLGKGSEELGGVLMNSFFYALSESDRIPSDIFLINSAVKLACDGSAVLDKLEKLITRGVNVYSCGICLDYFKIKDKIIAGEITNMYVIVETIMAGKVTII